MQEHSLIPLDFLFVYGLHIQYMNTVHSND
jgi:hypothetical protein